MSQLLTPRQAEELLVYLHHLTSSYGGTPADLECRHKSIIAYLGVAKLDKTAAVLREELGVGDSFDDATKKKYEGLLEKNGRAS